MARASIHIDISSEPGVREPVDQVKAAGVPAVLQIDNEDVAALLPPRRNRERRAGVLETDDPVLGLVGAFESNVPGGVSADKHGALLQAKRGHGV